MVSGADRQAEPWAFAIRVWVAFNGVTMMNLVNVLAEIMQPQTGWAPVAILMMVAILFAGGTLVASNLIGPKRQGPTKAVMYESGMMPMGDTRQQFNARFYIVAMIFVVFDVEIVFFYPWATIFRMDATPTLMWEMLAFVVILAVAYVYAWGKGVFQWD